MEELERLNTAETFAACEAFWPGPHARETVRISDALTAAVSSLSAWPRFLIAKGGITSSDVGTKALGVKKALVQGQAAPGIPVWKTGAKLSEFSELLLKILLNFSSQADKIKTSKNQ